MFCCVLRDQQRVHDAFIPVSFSRWTPNTNKGRTCWCYIHGCFSEVLHAMPILKHYTVCACVCVFSSRAASEQHALFICTDLQKQRYLSLGRGGDVCTLTYSWVLISYVVIYRMLGWYNLLCEGEAKGQPASFICSAVQHLLCLVGNIFPQQAAAWQKQYAWISYGLFIFNYLWWR